jgi:hypothetical protein
MAPTDSDDDSFFDDEDEEMSSDECQSKPITEPQSPQSSKPKLSKHLEQLQSRLGTLELLQFVFMFIQILIVILLQASRN